MQADSQPTGERWLPIQFVGSGSEYFRIWIVNLLLTLVTLGLYYPYAKVRRLRYFHGATEVGGHPLSFHGDAGKMLRGYLLVGLLFLAYAGAGHFSPVAGGAAFVAVGLLWPALWHSSLRFRMANTGWRGMRLQFTGTRGDAYRALVPAVLAVLLVVVASLLGPAPAPQAPLNATAPEQSTLQVVAMLLPTFIMALAMPALLWRMRRYQMNHLALGAEQTRFDVPLRSFYGVALKAFGLLLAFVLFVGLAAWLVLGSPAAAGGAPIADEGLLSLLPLLLMLLFLQVIFGPYFIARLQNLVWNRTRSRNLRFDSTLRVHQMALLSLRNWFFIIVTLGLYFPFAAVAMARLRLEAVSVGCQVDADTLFGSTERRAETAVGEAAGDLAGFDIGL